MILLHNVMGIIFRWKIFDYMLKIDILRNYYPKNLDVLRVGFWGFGYPKDALLAKTVCVMHLGIS